MNGEDRDALNLRLLDCLRVLVEERHVSRAADRLGMTQPKLSGMLARLRRATGDPLLVRTPAGMVPTETAVQLASHVDEFLGHWDGLTRQSTQFEPGASRTTVRVQVMDALVPPLIAPVVDILQREAAGCSVSLVMPALATMREALETGEVDLAIGIIPELPSDLFVSRIMSCYWRCIAAAAHPRIGDGLDLATYLGESHVVTTFGRPTQLSLTERHVEACIEEQGESRKIMAYVPTMLAVPDIVASTELVGLVPELVAVDAAARLPLRLFAPPVAMPPHDLVLVWHARTHNDPAQRWFREQFRTIAHRAA